MLVAPYLTLLAEDCRQRSHSLREVFNGLRYVVKTGAPWRWMPHDLPLWEIVYQQAQRWLKAGCLGAFAEDLRAVLRLAAGRAERPSAAIIDSRTLRSTPESGARAAYDGAKRKKGSKLHLAVDTLGHLLALHVTPADDRAEVGRMAKAVQAATGDSVDIAFVDQGYAGHKPAAAAAEHGIALEVVKLPKAKRGFVLLPRRWVVERSFAWATRFRCLVKDYERCAQTLADLHLVAFACIMLKNAAAIGDHRSGESFSNCHASPRSPTPARLHCVDQPGGLMALIGAWGLQSAAPEARRLAVTCALGGAVSLGVAWLLVSTILNNDLGWRAIMPGVIVLTAFAAAGLARWTTRPSDVVASLAALACLLAGAPGAVTFLQQDVAARPSASAVAFRQSPDLWRAVRRYAGPTERIANNPGLFADVTPWPINISWALLADRRSCYAGWELARPFAPAPRAEVERVDKEFRSAFDGTAPAETVRRLFAGHDCRLAVVTSADGAWSRGAFARDADFELLEESAGAWRIYRFKSQPGSPSAPSGGGP